MNRFCYTIVVFLIMAYAVRAAAALEEEQPLYYRDQAIVLLYHDVVEAFEPERPNSSTVTLKQLGEHLDMLERKGFEIIPMDTFLGFMLHGKEIPANAVVLTFDDGYESFNTAAYPVSRKHRATASNFVIGISSDLYDPDAEPHLNWEQMREMKHNGMSFYSHTYDLHRYAEFGGKGQTGPALTSLIDLKQKNRPEALHEYRRRILADMRFMEKRLQQELGAQPGLLAFPYGAYHDAVVEEGRKAGIKLFFTIEEGMNKPGDRLVRRVNAGEPYMSSGLLWHHLSASVIPNGGEGT